MKKTGLFLIGVLTGTIVLCQTNSTIAIVPEPVNIKQNTGYFKLPQTITIQAIETTDLKQTLADLQKKLSVPTSYKVSVAGNAPTAAIKLEVNKTENATLGNEGYILSVTPKNILIKENKPAGILFITRQYHRLACRQGNRIQEQSPGT